MTIDQIMKKQKNSSETRRCCKCEEYHPLSNFYIRKGDKNPNHCRFVARCKDCTKVDSKESKEHSRNSYLKRTYGITSEDYNKMLSVQGHRCAICGCHEDSKSIKLAVDHCHNTGRVRGILCSNCNTGIGYFKDNTESINQAALYLKR